MCVIYSFIDSSLEDGGSGLVHAGVHVLGRRDVGRLGPHHEQGVALHVDQLRGDVLAVGVGLHVHLDVLLVDVGAEGALVLLQGLQSFVVLQVGVNLE